MIFRSIRHKCILHYTWLFITIDTDETICSILIVFINTPETENET